MKKIIKRSAGTQLTAAMLLAAVLSAVPIPAQAVGTGGGYIDTAQTVSASDAQRAAPVLIINGRRVLQGRLIESSGVLYVPMFAFSDWLGKFSYTYDSSACTATVTGDRLSVRATVGHRYITVNGRCFYTEQPVMLHSGEVYVPIAAMARATNSRLTEADGTYRVYSGDSRLITPADSYYREDEVYWLAKIISAEARSESLEGKIAVGNVVLNRVRSRSFPNTIYGVIFDRRYGVQFSPVADGSIYRAATDESIVAARICLEGYTFSDEVLYFLNPAIATSTWIVNNRKYAFTIGRHSFYK